MPLSYNIQSTERAWLITFDVYNQRAIPLALYCGIT